MKDGKRKLAAIMFTDIVGYSALSHKNEHLALELLSEHRALVRPFFAEFHGTEIKTIGDAFLTQFDSAIGAVDCAVKIQRLFAERNKTLPVDRRMSLRISVHLGDVIDSDGDIYGDGVNVAARLLHFSQPGSICISEHVYDQIHNKTEYVIEKSTKRRLKNISKPLTVFHLHLDKATRPLQKNYKTWLIAGAASFCIVAAAAIALNLRTLKFTLSESQGRIAVMPFSNTSQQPEDEYLADGFTEELISGLARIPGLRVLAKSSVMQYKHARKSPEELNRELQISTLIEGSIRKSGDKLRINVHLIDARTQETLWSQDYDGNLKETFELQTKISNRIVAQMRGKLLANSLSEGAAPNNEAYLNYLKGRFYFSKRTEEGLRKGVEHLEAAVGTDPNFAPAFATMANALSVMSYYGYIEPKDAHRRGLAAAEKALALDPKSPDTWLWFAVNHKIYEHDWKEAEANYKRAIVLNPNLSTAHQWYGEFLTAFGRFEEAHREITKALDLDPLALVINLAAGFPYYYERNYDQAIKRYNAVVAMDPNFMLSYYWLGRCYTQLHRYDEALKQFQKASELSNAGPLIVAGLAHAYAVSGKTEEARKILNEMLEQAKSKYVSSYDLATIYAGLGDKENTIKHLGLAFEQRANHLVFLAVDPVFEPFHQDPGFLSLLKKLQLEIK